jgi:hypothetical protein
VANEGTTLIAIPYWWDGQEGRYKLNVRETMSVFLTRLFHSLIATVKKIRKDLLCEFTTVSSPISISPPKNFLGGRSCLLFIWYFA